MGEELNWAGNLRYHARDVLRPASLDELRAVVSHSERLRPLGSRHSFNALGDTTGDLVDINALPLDVHIDPDAGTVSVSAGATYAQLAEALHPQGWALANLASLPHISIAGAIATATHGSGQTNRNLAGAVCALDLVTATGDVVTLGEDDDDFAAVVVGLGAFGVVSRVTLRIEPAYDIAKHVYEDLPFQTLVEQFDDITAAAYSVSLFTGWTGDTVDMLWLTDRLGADGQVAHDYGDTLHGATKAGQQRHPVPGVDPVHTTEQLGVPGPWHDRLPHFRAGFKPSNGAEIQSEYLLPREHAAAAIRAVHAVGAQLAPALLVSEIRTVAADGLWLSSAYQSDAVALHFTWRRDAAAVVAACDPLEAALAPFQARPHWGKVFGFDAVYLAGVFPRLADFAAVVARYDPDHVFGNDFLAALTASA